ncbi:MAG: putative toxin-antitoxin system toxin component, PIN family [Bacteroidetes bacterium]|nr:putative toxin-antitoxin system toxin component, PIN family [Bacteroidota bacterium]
MVKGKNKSPVFVFDTNVWISFIISKKLDIIISTITEKNLIIFANDELLTEIQETLHKPKIKRHLTEELINEAVIVIRKVIRKKNNRNSIQVCRDPKDDYLIALASSVKADFLVTGDIDLLSLERVGKTVFVSLKSFTEMYNITQVFK